MKLENNGESEECVITGSILLVNVKRPKNDTIRISGVYQIVNQSNGKFYLGSSKDINWRWYRHHKGLVNNNHHSILLQRSWNKHTKTNFVCQVLEEVSTENLLEREQYYLDTLMPWKPEIGYNINRTANIGDWWEFYPYKDEYKTLFKRLNGGENNPMFGKHHSEETRKLIAERSVKVGKENGRWKEVDEETKQKILMEASVAGINASMRLGKQLGFGWRVVHRLLGLSY